MSESSYVHTCIHKQLKINRNALVQVYTDDDGEVEVPGPPALVIDKVCLRVICYIMHTYMYTCLFTCMPRYTWAHSRGVIVYWLLHVCRLRMFMCMCVYTSFIHHINILEMIRLLDWSLWHWRVYIRADTHRHKQTNTHTYRRWQACWSIPFTTCHNTQG
jgi:hypothetical protein